MPSCSARDLYPLAPGSAASDQWDGTGAAAARDDACRFKDRETRRLPINRLCSVWSYCESASNERLRVSNWMCKDSMIMQSRKPSNSEPGASERPLRR